MKEIQLLKFQEGKWIKVKNINDTINLHELIDLMKEKKDYTLIISDFKFQYINMHITHSKKRWVY